ncbi:MAG: hypothetical protein ACYDDF_03520 [Thermoplasmatota archaeon]
MQVHPRPSKEIRPAPPGLLQPYLSLADRLAGKGSNVVTLEEIGAVASSPGAGKQLAHLWTKHSLAVRLRHGRYALVDPSVAIRAWAIPPYFSDLLTLDDALTRAGITHGFACITAGQHADYVPERPFLVLRSSEESAAWVPHFAYNYPAKTVTKTRLDALGQRFHVPALSREQAALILASTSLPREVRAAKQLLHGHPMSDSVAKRLNALGLRMRKDVYESEDPRIRLPEFVEVRRDALAEETLKEAMT